MGGPASYNYHPTSSNRPNSRGTYRPVRWSKAADNEWNNHGKWCAVRLPGNDSGRDAVLSRRPSVIRQHKSLMNGRLCSIFSHPIIRAVGSYAHDGRSLPRVSCLSYLPHERVARHCPSQRLRANCGNTVWPHFVSDDALLIYLPEVNQIPQIQTQDNWQNFRIF